MEPEIDIDKHDERAHQLVVIKTVGRYALAGLLALFTLVGWRCESHRGCRSELVDAETSAAANLATAVECQRWTP